MTLRQELSSWFSPGTIPTSPAPSIDSEAPSTPQLPLPDSEAKPIILTFLRHCGCPFAEKTFRRFRSAAFAHPDVRFIAISHSKHSSTEKWVADVGGAGPVRVLVDNNREVYARCGLGVASFWHVLSPWSLWSVYQVGKEDDIWNRPTKAVVGGRRVAALPLIRRALCDGDKLRPVVTGSRILRRR